MEPEPVTHEKKSRFRKLRRFLIVFSLLASVSIFTALRWGPPLLVQYAMSFRVNSPEKSDAICILLGEFRVRPLRAAELYFRGYAPRILIVDFPDDMFFGSLESQLAQVMTLKIGLPAEKLERIRGRVTSTHEEARFYRDYAEKNGLKSLLIVTSSFHTRRSRWVFEKVFAGSGIKLSYAAARQPHIDETNWYRSDEGMSTYFNETVKTIYYLLRY